MKIPQHGQKMGRKTQHNECLDSVDGSAFKRSCSTDESRWEQAIASKKLSSSVGIENGLGLGLHVV